MVSLLIKKFVGYTRTVRIVYEYAATAVLINSCLNPVVLTAGESTRFDAV